MKNIQSTSGLIVGSALPCSMHPGDLSRIRQSPEWDLLRRQIVDKAIYFTDQLVFDFRRMLTQSRNAEMAGRLMWQLIKSHEPHVLIGPGFGASPLLYSTALAALADGVDLQVLMVRDRRKAHNQKRWVEGDHASAAGRRAVSYTLGLGSGADTIQENDATASNTDVLQFLGGISANQLWFRKTGNDLEASVIGTADKATVQNWYLGSQYHLEQIKAGDGKVLLDTQVESLVQAMASFTPPAMGQTALSTSQQTALAPVLAANWH